jgi:hypothetical protein
MLIPFNLSHVFYPGADMVMNIQTCREMMEFLIRANLIYLTRARNLGHSIPSLYASGVTYRRVEEWEPIPALYARKWGDCKNLAAALIAERRFKGVRSQPAFRWVENADHSIDYHILEQTGTTFEDPSLKLGMGKDEVAKFYAA